MSDRFPGLGHDPAPGDPDEVRRCAREYARAAAELDQLAADLARLAEVSSFWRGTAASAFTGVLSPLPGMLGTAASSCAAICARLTAWAGELEDLRGEARVLERAASAALDRLQAAHARAGALPAGELFLGLPHAVDVAEPEQELRRIEARASELHARWSASGQRAAAAIDAATVDAPALPRSLGELVWQHRQALALIATTADLVSLPAVAIPLVGPAVSGGLSAVAFTSQTALAVHADGSGADVALGAVGVGTAGGAAAAGRVAQGPVLRRVARGLDHAGVGSWVVGTWRTVAGGSSTSSTSPTAARSAQPTPPRQPSGGSSATLGRLLVTPVTGAPPRAAPVDRQSDGSR